MMAKSSRPYGVMRGCRGSDCSIGLYLSKYRADPVNNSDKDVTVDFTVMTE
jgi:hypothetical protein